MKFPDKTWAQYRMLFPVADTDRDRIEQQLTTQQEKWLAEAGDDIELMFGFFNLDTAKEIAEACGCSDDFVLDCLIRRTPEQFRAQVQAVIRRARSARGGH